MDCVDDVDRVAQPQPALGGRVLRRDRVVAVVVVQHDVPGAGQPVLLAAHALAVDVDRGVDVAVRQHHAPGTAPCPAARRACRRSAGRCCGRSRSTTCRRPSARSRRAGPSARPSYACEERRDRHRVGRPRRGRGLGVRVGPVPASAERRRASRRVPPLRARSPLGGAAPGVTAESRTVPLEGRRRAVHSPIIARASAGRSEAAGVQQVAARRAAVEPVARRLAAPLDPPGQVGERRAGARQHRAQPVRVGRVEPSTWVPSSIR